MVTSKKIVVATLGSLGDLNPCIAIALELKSRGHDVSLAGSESYRRRVTKSGLSFHSMRPNLRIDEDLVARILEKDGAEYFVRRVLIANIAETYHDLTHACRTADLLISGDLVLAAPLVAQKQRILWVSAVLSPSSFGSVYDFYPKLALKLGNTTARSISWAMNELAHFTMRSWIQPITMLRRELGLTPDRHPLTVGRFSPRLVLALFSCVLGGPYPDWPPSTRVTGAVFYDDDEHGDGISAEVQEFLREGEPPLVFTLGSSAALRPGTFYEESIKAADLIGQRALLLVGKNSQTLNLGADMLACDYAPYSELFPRAAAVILAAGAGSIAHALRAGCPMLLLPYGGFDQPLNAARLERLGLSRAVDPSEYSAGKAAAEISTLLKNREYTDRLRNVSQLVNAENGLQVACELLEEQMKEAAA